MAMTRKDYVRIAQVLRHNRVENKPELGQAYGKWAQICEDLAEVFENENSAFDYNRFMEACGHD